MSGTKKLTALDAVNLALTGDYHTWNNWSEDNSGQYLDFTFITVDKKYNNLDFSNFIFTGPVNFSHIRLVGVKFKYTKFEERALFTGTVFRGYSTNFEECQFLGGVIFYSSKFMSSYTIFRLAKFLGSEADFSSTTFELIDEEDQHFSSSSTVLFYEAIFDVERIEFSNSIFTDVGELSFERARFNGELVNFYGAKLKRSNLFFGASLCEAEHFRFKNIQFQDGIIVFQNMEFSGEFEFSYSDIAASEFRFEHVIFQKLVHFSQTRFLIGNLDFLKINFLGTETNFDNIVVQNGNVNFSNSETTGQISFAGSIFNQSLDFENTSFKAVPDFRRTQIAAHFTFHAMTIDAYDPMEVVGNEQDKYRRLKEIAIQSKDHEKEFEFFANELRAKNHEENIGIAKLPIWIYEIVSDFGRSIFMPFFGLVYTFMVYANIYAQIIINWKPDTPNIMGVAHQYSLAMLTPFAPSSRQALADLRNSLSTLDSGIWLDILSVSETVLGIAFLFLIGLALRNRFRL